jgi:hypothetical protein
MRGNARGRKEEVHTTINTTDDENRRNNTKINQFTGEGVTVMVKAIPLLFRIE